MDLELFESLSKYPFIYEGKFHDTIELRQNKTCVDKCKEKDCLQLFLKDATKTEYICSKGYDNQLIIIGGVKFIINGLIYTNNTIVPKGRKVVREAWVVDREAVQLFVKKLEEIEKHLVTRENETTLKNFTIFHDFKTSMNIFFTCTQDIISNLQGNTFEEKLKGSGKSYQDLYHSLRLITSQLRMIDIIINPTSIGYGNKKLINIYQLFEKMKFLFTHIASKKREVGIRIITDEWVKDSYCYDSIEFIPLILLDNAIKYSAPDSDIEIKFEQSFRSVKVIVRSIGPVVSDKNKDKIFDKFFRDEGAIEFSKDGLGIGLWVAQQILDAHNSKLFYFKNLNETRLIGLNVFEFNLETVQL